MFFPYFTYLQSPPSPHLTPGKGYNNTYVTRVFRYLLKKLEDLHWDKIKIFGSRHLRILDLDSSRTMLFLKIKIRGSFADENRKESKSVNHGRRLLFENLSYLSVAPLT